MKFNEGDLKFYWVSGQTEFEVLVPDVQTAIVLFKHHMLRDLEDDTVVMNIGGLQVWEEVENEFDWYEWYDEDQNDLGTLVDLEIREEE